MTISARVHYASLALVELAIRKAIGRPIAASEISDATGIPGPFLMQILRTLRSAGWVQSIRGSQGGYLLAVDPSTITLLEIATVVGCSEGGQFSEAAGKKSDRLLQEVWRSADEASRNVMAQTTLADIAARSASGDEVMFYI